MFTKEAREASAKMRARLKRMCLSAVGGTAAWKKLTSAERKAAYTKAKAEYAAAHAPKAK